MDPFFELTHYAAQEALRRSGRIVSDIEKGRAPSETDVAEFVRAAEDVETEYLSESEDAR